MRNVRGTGKHGHMPSEASTCYQHLKKLLRAAQDRIKRLWRSVEWPTKRTRITAAFHAIAARASHRLRLADAEQSKGETDARQDRLAEAGKASWLVRYFCVWFPFYVAACFATLVLSNEFTRSHCWRLLAEKSIEFPAPWGALVSNNTVTVTSPKDTTPIIIGVVTQEVPRLIVCGDSEFTPHQTPRRFWLLFSFGTVLLLTGTIAVVTSRCGGKVPGGILILALFVTVSVLMEWSYTHRPVSVSVAAIAFFYGALFWTMDGVLNKNGFAGDFYKLLDGFGSTDASQVARLNALYDHSKTMLTSALTVFAAVNILLAWNVISSFDHSYQPAGLAGRMIVHLLTLDFAGSLGLLGCIATEFGLRLEAILVEMRREAPYQTKQG